MAAISTLRPVKRWSGERASPAQTRREDEDGRSRAHLKQLIAMRTVAIVVQLGAILAAEQILEVHLPSVAMVLVLAALGTYNAWTWRRSREPFPVTDAELLRQLSLDVAALTLVLAMAGGASNPFASIFLLPLAVGATCLSRRRTWFLAFGTVVCYGLLIFVSRPLAFNGGQTEHLAVLTTGMWVSYTVTALAIASFLARAAGALRRDERMLAAERDKAVNNEHILRIGTLAAGAAHELSSPLGSIAVIVEDLRRRHGEGTELGEELETVSRQLASCRETLTTLLSYGHGTFAAPAAQVSFDQFIRGCVESFSARRPEAAVTMRIESGGEAPRMVTNPAICQALTSLLDNAADVSRHSIEVHVGWDAEWMRVSISDRGPGFPPEMAEGLGQLFFTTKGRGKGNGLGLYLANTAVVRLGGSLTLANAEGGGAVVQIALPVSEMSALSLSLDPRE
jgi:two-component system sensor histidine kinase RegB